MKHIEHEKKIVSLMIQIYCKKNHHCSELCEECQDLQQFAYKRLNACPYQEKKSFCAHCPTQCYTKNYKERMKNVMKFSGKYMLLINPLLFFQHAIISLVNKKHMKVKS